jgi:ParB family transcriptional regulator, chromosome partitioning protein
LGWRKVVCHVLELDDRETFEVTLIENIQRENLNPTEEALAVKNPFLLWT